MMKIEFKSKEEAKAILHALKRTNARNSYGDLNNILDHCENFEQRLFDLINKPVETTNEQPKIYKAIRRVENVGEFVEGRGTFFELIELYDDKGNVVTKSLCTHPESHFNFTFQGVEYYSLPHSNGVKPVYHRLIV